MYKLLYPSIRVRTAPPVSVRVRTRVSVSFSFTVLRVSRGLLRFGSQLEVRSRIEAWKVADSSYRNDDVVCRLAVLKIVSANQPESAARCRKSCDLKYKLEDFDTE